MQSSLINNGRDLHLHHGPIDLIISASGASRSITRAFEVAEDRFSTVLDGLVAELDILRQPVAYKCNVSDPVARRMWQATSRHANDSFITPMAAVAGSVADEVLSVITRHANGLTKVSVNNGGDIALWLAEGESSTVGVADPLSGDILARAVIASHDAIAGIATSGRTGRSLSCGIADSVTVLAASAAAADAAATLVANAVDLPDNPKVKREPAIEIDPNTDLRNRAVTVGVQHLTETECSTAIKSGLSLAEQFVQGNYIRAAYLILQGRCVTTESFGKIMHANITNQLKG